jgi:3-oxoacyl-[acyl-carrier-protein] synthase I
MSRDPVIVGSGLVTAVGLTTTETAASVRAGTSRFAETRIQDKALAPFVLATVPDDALPPLQPDVVADGMTAREVRLMRLGTSALRECVSVLPPSEVRPPLIIALPEHDTDKPIDDRRFLERLARQAPGTFDPARSDASSRGRAGGLIAVGHAAHLVQSGHLEIALAGGIDSYRDLYMLGLLDQQSRVKSASNLDGFIPGEGAAFVLVASAGVAMRYGLTVLARLTPTAIAREPGHLYSEEPYRGEGLVGALQQLRESGAFSAPLQEVYCSMNGERHWTKEWGIARIRLRDAFAPEHGMHHPAECFGDIGGAAGPALAALSALGVGRGYRRSPTLVYASSDHELRAALVVSTA